MIEKRELYKALKKHKVFAKYCLGVSQAYAVVDSRFLPRERYQWYYDNVFRGINQNDLDSFAEEVKRWKLKADNIKILP